MVIGRHGLLVAFTASAIVAPAFAAKRDNSIRIAVEQVLSNVDAYFNQQRAGFNFAHQIWDTLIYRDPRTGEYKGQLATAWRWVDDRTLEVELRRGVKFHNGAMFDADDVVSTLTFASKPENKIVRRAAVDWIARVEKIDAYRVRIVAKEPSPAAIELLSVFLFIYPHEYYAKVGPLGMSEKPVGSGPFRVLEHARGRYIRLEANPEYFKESPKPQPRIEKLEIRFIPDLQTQIAELLAGNVDVVVNATVDQARQLRRAPHLQVVPGDTLRIAYLHLNGSENTPTPPLRDIRVRRAILHAIDREAMVRSLVAEGARPVHALCHPSQFGCVDERTPRYDYDPSKAKQLLAEAGFENGFDVDLYATNLRDRTQTEAMIGYLRAVGIRANLRFVQNPALVEARRAGKLAMEHGTWGPSIYDVSATTPVFFAGYPDDMNRDLEVRDLLARGDTSLDPNLRKDLYAKALALIQERAYVLPLFTVPIYYISQKDLVFTAYPDEMTRFWEMSWR